MRLGIVKGSVVATRKCDKLRGCKLLLIEPYYGDSKEIYVAADQLGAGEGETVLITTDYSVQATLEQEMPIDSIVVGIVDHPPKR